MQIRKMDDVSIEFSVSDSGEAESKKMTPRIKNSGFSALHAGVSDCFACMPNLLPSSTVLDIDVEQSSAPPRSNSSASRIVDEENQSILLGDSATKKTSTNETDSEMSDASITQADPFAHREGKTLSWRNVNMILVRRQRETSILANKMRLGG